MEIWGDFFAKLKKRKISKFLKFLTYHNSDIAVLSPILFWVCWSFSIVFIFKSERVIVIPANPYFWPKVVEHDDTLTSLTADLA